MFCPPKLFNFDTSSRVSAAAAASLRADLEGISRVKNNTSVPAPFVVGGNWIYIFEFAPDLFTAASR